MLATETTVDFAKYNGKLTCYNPATGQHRTFQIKTAQKGNLKGERIISMLTGPDNQFSYTGFGFIGSYGEIILWKKRRGTQYEKLAMFLSQIDHHIAENGIEVQFAVRCRKCNRELTEPDSIELGIGPVCRGEM